MAKRLFGCLLVLLLCVVPLCATGSTSAVKEALTVILDADENIPEDIEALADALLAEDEPEGERLATALAQGRVSEQDVAGIKAALIAELEKNIPTMQGYVMAAYTDEAPQVAEYFLSYVRSFVTTAFDSGAWAAALLGDEKSFAEEVSSAKGGETITVQTDLDYTSAASPLSNKSKKGVTLDLNGHTLSQYVFGEGTFYIENGTLIAPKIQGAGKSVTLYIGENVTVNSLEDTYALSIWRTEACDLTLVNNGLIKGAATLHVEDNFKGGKLSITNNGRIEGQKSGSIIDVWNSKTKVTFINNGAILIEEPGNGLALSFTIRYGSAAVENHGTITGGLIALRPLSAYNGKISVINSGEVSAPQGIALHASSYNALTIKGGGTLRGACALLSHCTNKLTVEQNLYATSDPAIQTLDELLSINGTIGGTALYQAEPSPISFTGTLWATDSLAVLDMTDLGSRKLNLKAEIDPTSPTTLWDMRLKVSERPKVYGPDEAIQMAQKAIKRQSIKGLADSYVRICVGAPAIDENGLFIRSLAANGPVYEIHAGIVQDGTAEWDEALAQTMEETVEQPDLADAGGMLYNAIANAPANSRLLLDCDFVLPKYLSHSLERPAKLKTLVIDGCGRNLSPFWFDSGSLVLENFGTISDINVEQDADVVIRNATLSGLCYLKGDAEIDNVTLSCDVFDVHNLTMSGRCTVSANNSSFDLGEDGTIVNNGRIVGDVGIYYAGAALSLTGEGRFMGRVDIVVRTEKSVKATIANRFEELRIDWNSAKNGSLSVDGGIGSGGMYIYSPVPVKTKLKGTAENFFALTLYIDDDTNPDERMELVKNLIALLDTSEFSFSNDYQYPISVTLAHDKYYFYDVSPSGEPVFTGESE